MQRSGLLLAALLALLAPVRGATVKPVSPQKPPSSDFDDFNLEDAFGPSSKPDLPAKPKDSDNPRPATPVKPREPGGFDDSDLFDGDLPKEGGGGSSGGNGERDTVSNKGGDGEASQGAIAGIVSAVAATAIGAVSSFIAYQKKKLCFKQSDEENVNMDSHRGAQSEPPVQRTLLEN
ncbi:CD99 antigen isoform X2 [Phasianus colchicus]|uniref:CD99 molecule (Xg blood group) n=1 Tax=Phasianus colchicus TaxID=9054 RepID=A0A669Q5Z1_PHACC|nr:CD99 antigen isoform X2 [Phasianus colchicus]